MKLNLTVGERVAEEDGRAEPAAAKLQQSCNLTVFFYPLSVGVTQCPELQTPRKSKQKRERDKKANLILKAEERCSKGMSLKK